MPSNTKVSLPLFITFWATNWVRRKEPVQARKFAGQCSLRRAAAVQPLHLFIRHRLGYWTSLAFRKGRFHRQAPDMWAYRTVAAPCWTARRSFHELVSPQRRFR